MNKIEELKMRIEGVDASLEYFKQVKSELETELKELEKQEEQEWKPQMNERYWTIDLGIMMVMSSGWDNAIIDNTRLKRKVIFKTRDEAEEYLEYLQAKEKAMNEFSKAEWEKKLIEKWRFYYDYEYNDFRVVDAYAAKHINGMYFRTKESAQEFINKYEKFMKRELGI